MVEGYTPSQVGYYAKGGTPVPVESVAANERARQMVIDETEAQGETLEEIFTNLSQTEIDEMPETIADLEKQYASAVAEGKNHQRIAERYNDLVGSKAAYELFQEWQAKQSSAPAPTEEAPTTKPVDQPTKTAKHDYIPEDMSVDVTTVSGVTETRNAREVLAELDDLHQALSDVLNKCL
jgi:hypothetical protein